MRPRDKTAPAQGESLELQFELQHAPEKVWRALTDPTLLAEWLLPVVGSGLQPGLSFQFKRPEMPGWDGTVHCRVLEFEAQKRLSYAWVVGVMELDTIVTFTLDPTEFGTRLTLIHSGFKPAQKQNFGGARYGWRMMGEQFVALLERMS